MAIIYLRYSDGLDADNGSTWALAKKTLAAALTAATAGSTIYVSHAHAETQSGAMTLTSAGTPGNMVRVICINDSTGVLATTATVSTTSTATITFVGSAFFYGITFSASSTSAATPLALNNTATNWLLYFKNCILKTLSTSGSQSFAFGTASATAKAPKIVLESTTLSFNNAGGRVTLGNVKFVWKNTATAFAGTLPTGGAFRGSTYGFKLEISGVNLAPLGANPLVLATSTGHGKLSLRNCSLASNAVLSTGTIPNTGGMELNAVNCGYGDTNYNYYRTLYTGTIIQSTTIYRNDGWYDGTTRISRKITTLATANIINTLSAPTIIYPYNVYTGSPITATLHLLTDNVVLTNENAWLEIEYLGNNNSTQSVEASSARTILGPIYNLEESTKTWTTSGISIPIKQKVSVSFTPLVKGPIYCTLKIAKPSIIVYYCPRLELV